MDTHCWKCPLCGIEEPAADMDGAKAMLEAHEADAHKGKPVGSFGEAWKPVPLVPVWPDVPITVFTDGTYTVGGVKHAPTSVGGWKLKA